MNVTVVRMDEWRVESVASDGVHQRFFPHGFAAFYRGRLVPFSDFLLLFFVFLFALSFL